MPGLDGVDWNKIGFLAQGLINVGSAVVIGLEAGAKGEGAIKVSSLALEISMGIFFVNTGVALTRACFCPSQQGRAKWYDSSWFGVGITIFNAINGFSSGLIANLYAAGSFTGLKSLIPLGIDALGNVIYAGSILKDVCCNSSNNGERSRLINQ